MTVIVPGGEEKSVDEARKVKEAITGRKISAEWSKLFDEEEDDGNS